MERLHEGGGNTVEREGGGGQPSVGKKLNREGVFRLLPKSLYIMLNTRNCFKKHIRK